MLLAEFSIVCLSDEDVNVYKYDIYTILYSATYVYIIS